MSPAETIYIARGDITIQEGVTFVFKENAVLCFEEAALLKVEETAKQPVVLTAEEGAGICWQGIWINGSVSQENSFTYTEVRRAGGNPSGPKAAMNLWSPS